MNLTDTLTAPWKLGLDERDIHHHPANKHLIYNLAGVRKDKSTILQEPEPGTWPGDILTEMIFKLKAK